MTEEIKTDAIVEYGKPYNMPIASAADLRQLLLANQNNIKKLIPPESGVTWQKMESSVMEIAITNPGILDCDGYSVLIAVKTACELGLALIPSSGEAYLVPFFDKKINKKKCQLMIGYKGKHRLIIENTDVVMINTVVVYKGDQFEIREGTSPEIIHVINPAAPRDVENIVGFYSIAFFANGFKHIEWMNKDEVDAIRTRSKAPQFIWKTDYTEMGKKTVDHRHFKRIPLSGAKANLLHKLLQYEYDNEGLKDQTVPAISPEDRMKRLQERLHKAKEEGKEEPPKEQPLMPKKEGEVIDLSEEEENQEELPIDMVEEGFKYAGIMDKKEQARLTKKFEGRQDVLNDYLNLLADWDSDQEQGTRPNEPE